MPDIRYKETCEAIARSYVRNGFNKAQAMLDAGYKRAYAFCGRGQALYKKAQVKEAILKEMANLRAESADKADYIRHLHEAGVKLSLEKGDLVNYTRNVEGLGRSYAVYTDKYQDNDKQVRPALSPEQQERYKLLAREMTKRDNKKPKTA
jgi:hypothetical protein